VSVQRHIVGVMLTAMMVISLPGLSCFAWMAVNTYDFVHDHFVGRLLILLIIVFHAIGTVIFGTRVLSRRGDYWSSAFALFVALLLPTILGVAVTLEYLTRPPYRPALTVY